MQYVDDPEDSWTSADVAAVESNPIRICVAGYTNAGKTSWLANLPIQSAEWRKDGKVSNRVNTTLAMDKCEFKLSKERTEPYLILYDSPGLVYSREILEQLTGLSQRRRPNKKDIIEYLEREDSSSAFAWMEPVRLESEKRILLQILGCDAVILLIDCEQGDLERLEAQVELLRLFANLKAAILNKHKKNKVSADTLDRVKEMLNQLGVGQILEFDAFIREPKNDGQLRDAVLAGFNQDRQKKIFVKKYFSDLANTRNALLEDAADIAADFLVSLAACKKRKHNVDRETLKENKNSLLEQLLKAHNSALMRTIDSLKKVFDLRVDVSLERSPDLDASVYKRHNPLAPKEAVVQDGRRRSILGRIKDFALPERIEKISDVVRQILAVMPRSKVQYELCALFGLAGAASGLVIDALLHGTTLLSGAVTGGTIGMGLAASVIIGFYAKYEYTGKLGELTCEATKKAIEASAEDMLSLVYQLHYRGYANTEDIAIRSRDLPVPTVAVKQIVRVLAEGQRPRPEWCTWGKQDDTAEEPEKRKEKREQLSRLIAECVSKQMNRQDRTTADEFVENAGNMGRRLFSLWRE